MSHFNIYELKNFFVTNGMTDRLSACSDGNSQDVYVEYQMQDKPFLVFKIKKTIQIIAYFMKALSSAY